MQHAYDTNSVPAIPKALVAILQSKWHSQYTDRMIEKCIEVLLKAGALQPEVHVLPGSLELPLGAQTLACRKDRNYESLICFGAIVKGDTYHFDIVMQGSTQGLSRVSLEQDIPVLVEVIPVNDLEQLRKRSADDSMNKGYEAGIAAAEIIAWRRKIGYERKRK